MNTARILACGLALCAASAARAAGPHLSTAAASQLDEGLHRLYSLDYVRSRESFHKLIELEPENPFGYLFEAGAIWWQALQEYGLFQSSPELQKLFEQDIERTLRSADSNTTLEKTDANFVIGMALGTRGQWNLLKRHYLDAYFDGKKAVKHLKKCVKLDPEYNEAYLGLGVFDYQAAHLSGVARLGTLFGVRGDEKRGLERLQLAVDKSRYASAQAAQFLATIYISELHDYARALPVVQRLRHDFPESPYFLFLEALLRHRLGDWDGSLLLGRELHKRAGADPAAFRRKWLTLACGLSGSDCLEREELDRFLAWTDHALQSSGQAQGPFQAWVRTLRGQTLDALGRRADAVADYRRVLALPSSSDNSHSRAKACLDAACDRSTLLKLLQDMSREAPAGHEIVTPNR